MWCVVAFGVVVADASGGLQDDGMDVDVMAGAAAGVDLLQRRAKAAADVETQRNRDVSVFHCPALSEIVCCLSGQLVLTLLEQKVATVDARLQRFCELERRLEDERAALAAERKALLVRVRRRHDACTKHSLAQAIELQHRQLRVEQREAAAAARLSSSAGLRASNETAAAVTHQANGDSAGASVVSNDLKAIGGNFKLKFTMKQ